MLLPFKEKDLFGMINEEGEIVIAPLYQKLSKVKEGYSLGSKDEKWFYIDERGKVVKRFNVDGMELFSEGLAKLNLVGCVGFINRKFQVIVEPKYGLGSCGFHEGYASVCTPKIIETKLYGFIDEKGNEVIDLKYDFSMNFNEGLAIINIGEMAGAINKSGKIIIKTKYDWINNFNEGRALFYVGDQWGVVDNKGNEIVKAKLNDVDEFYDFIDFAEEYACICNCGKFGFIDKSGNMVSDFIYDDVHSFQNG